MSDLTTSFSDSVSTTSSANGITASTGFLISSTTFGTTFSGGATG